MSYYGAGITGVSAIFREIGISNNGLQDHSMPSDGHLAEVFEALRVANQHKAYEFATQMDRLKESFLGQAKLRADYLELILDNSSDILILGTNDGRRLYVSRAVTKVLGFSPAEALAQTPTDGIHPEDVEAMLILCKNMLEDRSTRSVQRMRYQHKCGHYVWIEASVEIFYGFNSCEPVGYIAALRDVTSHNEAETRALYLSMHDSLTGLPNRVLFRDRVSRALMARPGSDGSQCLLACDLDGFQAANDTLGHPAGDAVLQIVAGRMASVLQQGDMLARVGGDKFSVLSGPLKCQGQAREMAERLIAAVSRPLDIDGRVLNMGLSVGFEMLDKPLVSLPEVINRADIALFQAKKAGRNIHRQYDAESGKRIWQRRQLKIDMNEAISRNEFYVVYQPVISVSTGRVVTCEALLRWNHPTFGNVAPDVFIPIAEESGLIIRLGDWVLRQACVEACHWHGDVRVAVNISAAQIAARGLKNSVSVALSECDLSPSLLKLEVTEGVLISDGDWALNCLRELQGDGVQVALDDFGTGYASMTYLRKFGFDKIKLDKSFIRDIGEPRTLAIIRGMLDICHRLDIGVVAEGVETEDQLDMLKGEGCDLIQGFLFSRPLSPVDVREYISGRNGGGI